MFRERRSTVMRRTLASIVAAVIMTTAACAPATPAATLTPVPTTTPVPVAPETLLPQAKPLCEAAFSALESTETPKASVITLINKDYEDKQWNHETVLPHFTAPSASEVQTLICIRETREQVWEYEDRMAAYQLTWEVRLVRWPDGQVIGTNTLPGWSPPASKPIGGPAYGDRPIELLFEWLEPALGDRSILYHAGPVYDVAFSSDGRILASTRAWRVVLWDIPSGEELNRFKGHTDAVTSVTFSPDGKTLASGSSDFTAKLWDVTSGKELRTFQGHTGKVTSVAFSPDGKTLASGSSDFTAKLWDAATGQVMRSLDLSPYPVADVAFSPDGKTLTTASGRTVKLWETTTGRELLTLEDRNDPGYFPYRVVFSSNGKTIATGGSVDNRIGAVKLWSVATGQMLQTLTSPYASTDISYFSSVYDLTFSPDGKTLAVSGEEKIVVLWDVGAGQVLRTLRGHIGAIWSVAFSPDGKMLASGSEDFTVKLWDVAMGR